MGLQCRWPASGLLAPRPRAQVHHRAGRSGPLLQCRRVEFSRFSLAWRVCLQRSVFRRSRMGIIPALAGAHRRFLFRRAGFVRRSHSAGVVRGRLGRARRPHRKTHCPPQADIETLAERYLESVPATKGPRAVSARGRAALHRNMLRPFEDAGVLALMEKEIRVSKYGSTHDQLKIDCGYRPDGTFKLFHAVSLRTDPDYAKSLAFSYPRLAAGMARMEKLEARLTAVIENDLDRKSAPVAFAYEAFEESRIAVATLSEVPRLAEIARKELKV